MPAPLLAVVLWTCILAAAVAQVMILRSTARTLRRAQLARPFREWAFAIVPALVLVLVLFLSWRAAMRPLRVDVTGPAAPGSVIG